MKLSLFLLSTATMVNAATAASGGANYTNTVDLGTAGDYAILSKSGISTVPDSVITGHIAVSPIGEGAITGFKLVMDPSGHYSSADQVDGNVFTPDYVNPTPSDLTTAVKSMEKAYNTAAARLTTDGNTNLMAGILDGLTLTSGVYTFDRDVSIGTQTELTFDAEGDPDAVFIIQTTGSVRQAEETTVNVVGSADAANIFWVVAGEVEVGAGATMEGVLLVKTAVKFITGSNLNGRILAQTAVTLQSATITDPGE
jgi:hypothetical protein